MERIECQHFSILVGKFMKLTLQTWLSPKIGVISGSTGQLIVFINLINMPEIIGKRQDTYSAMTSLDAHVAHLKHLANQSIARRILKERHGHTDEQAKKTAPVLSSHVRQGIAFHLDSRSASKETHPALQYYAFLNLSVAVILAFRPVGFQGYKSHGVEDRTHSLNAIKLSSKVLKVNRGAVPLFHSILSDVDLRGKEFRISELVAAFHMCSHELTTQFNKKVQSIQVRDSLKNINGKWHSCFDFFRIVGVNTTKRLTKKRLEDAMPLLKSDYRCLNVADKSKNSYVSKQSWTGTARAKRTHERNGIKFINYGGQASHVKIYEYCWCGTLRAKLLPTLSSILLLSFSLASIVRYRPALLNAAFNSPIYLILDVFTTEADQIFIPSIRNLIYREETRVLPYPA